MATKLYVGGLAWATTDESLGAYFAQLGAVESARVVTDRETGRSRGFGFVEMTNDADAQAAIERLSGTELDGRAISVSIARPPEEGGARRSPAGGSRGGFGGGSRGGFGGGRDRNDRY